MDATTLPERPEALLGALRLSLGPQAVLTGADVPIRNCNDWSASLPQTPLAVVRPLDAAGVSEAIATCRKARLPFVPQGGLTGLCRGAANRAGSRFRWSEWSVSRRSIAPARP